MSTTVDSGTNKGAEETSTKSEVRRSLAVDPHRLARRLQPMAAPLPFSDEGLLTSPQSANTFGWDTVFALSFAEANAGIRSAKSTPKTLHYEEDDGGESYSVSGDFSPWSLGLGSDGKNIRFNCPIPKLTYRENGETTTYEKVSATVIVTMTFRSSNKIRDNNDAFSDAGTSQDLVIDTGNTAVVPSLEFGGEVKPSKIKTMLIRGFVECWFQQPESLAQFSHVFASVNLGARAAQDAFQWMMPTSAGYAVVGRDSLETSTLAITCMTQDRQPPASGHQVSPFAIPQGQSSGFLINYDRFLEKMLMPGIGQLFTGPLNAEAGKQWPQDYFELDAAEGTIVNNAAICIEEFEVTQGETYRATIGEGNFSVRIFNTYLQTEFVDLHHEYNKFLTWLNVFHTVRSRCTAGLTDQTFDLMPGEGTHHIVITKDKTAQWIEIGLLTASLVAIGVCAAAKGWMSASSKVASTTAEAATVTAQTAVTAAPTAAQSAAFTATSASSALGLMRTGLVKGAEFLQSYSILNRASLVASMTGAAWAVIRILEVAASLDTKANSLPNFNEFAASVMAPIQWPHQKSGYQVNQVQFNGAFQIGGEFKDPVGG